MFIASAAFIQDQQKRLTRVAKRTPKRLLELQKALPCTVYTPPADEAVQVVVQAGIATGAPVAEIFAATQVSA
jgi:hypothetical protein